MYLAVITDCYGHAEMREGVSFIAQVNLDGPEKATQGASQRLNLVHGKIYTRGKLSGEWREPISALRGGEIDRLSIWWLQEA